jgi:hypothetical protein
MERLKKAVRSAGFLDAEGNEISTFDPLEELAKISADPRLDYSIRLAALKEVSRYTYPQLKGLEVKGDPEAPLQVVRRNFGDGPDDIVTITGKRTN